MTKSETFSFVLTVIFLLILALLVKEQTPEINRDTYQIAYEGETEPLSGVPPQETEEEPAEPDILPQTEEPTEGEPSPEDTGGLIDLNTATREELDTLDGIGEKLSQAIIDYRQQHGGFSTVEELMEVDGIGEKTFEKNRDRICVTEP